MLVALGRPSTAHRRPGPDRVYGWRLRAGDLDPLTAGEIFDAYCTDIDSGDPISPEYDVGQIRYGSRGFDPYRRPTKVQVKDGEQATPCRMLHYSPVMDSPFSDSPHRGY
ncbi:hypothetical protein GCM10010256_09420 [Streptomyces coeruleorubidus]|uniref:Uncharacterized protein n=1 Tax=Streptomyces coeruleorubidus TaxID=116188 RepID=A0A5J6HYZ1_STRC4|nr:hypothetical protein CP976_12880 [Streptomyces coeruleorubidus]GGT54627.1 hypothetical protein GCM10010256_09420 [Streptomyces coeruleorubidus]